MFENLSQQMKLGYDDQAKMNAILDQELDRYKG